MRRGDRLNGLATPTIIRAIFQASRDPFIGLETFAFHRPQDVAGLYSINVLYGFWGPANSVIELSSLPTILSAQLCTLP